MLHSHEKPRKLRLDSLKQKLLKKREYISQRDEKKSN